MEYIYFGRTSFCMGDDVNAPNIRRFEYQSNSFKERDFRECIINYFESNLVHFKWNGYCNGEILACVECLGEGESYQVNIELVDDWKNLLDRNRVVFFDHHLDDECEYGIQKSKYYTLKRTEEFYKEDSNPLG